MGGAHPDRHLAMGRHDIARHIVELDPERDHVEIVHDLVGWGFPWDWVCALEMALRRTNRFHRRHDIPSEDFLHVLTTFHLEPIRWLDRCGWRGRTEAEKDASYGRRFRDPLGSSSRS